MSEQDQRRPLLQPNPGNSSPTSDISRNGSFLDRVAEGIQAKDRERFQQHAIRYTSFIVAILSCLCCGSITAFSLYGPLFIKHLHYSQAAVNIVSLAAELGLYLLVPVFGYFCDRHGTKLPSILAGLLFGGGYLTAALAYNAGPPASESGWPFWSMVLAFAAIGMGTCAMYLTAVSTCAKNFGRGRYRGFALSAPIAAFGLSGMLVSQLGSRVLYKRDQNQNHDEVDVYKFFVVLGIVLFFMGMIGSVTLKIVDEGEMIEEAIDQLEQSGLVPESEFFSRAASEHGYGTINHNDLSVSTVNFLLSEAEAIKQREDQERARKEWLLNAETKRFLHDRTMWWMAVGFFLITGPGEAYINNMGTIIGTLYAPEEELTTHPATHVTIIALTSTISRVFIGTVTDLLAPIADPHQHNRGPNSASQSFASLPAVNQSYRFSISRVYFLIAFGLVLSLGQILLGSGIIQNHGERLWIVSSFIGSGYGAIFALTPIIISVVWGVENFATNWGIVATVPAAGAVVWGTVYSIVYEIGANGDPVIGLPEEEIRGMCFGVKCYAATFWAMAVCSWIACGLWIYAWKGKGGWKNRGIAV